MKPGLSFFVAVVCMIVAAMYLCKKRNILPGSNVLFNLRPAFSALTITTSCFVCVERYYIVFAFPCFRLQEASD